MVELGKLMVYIKSKTNISLFVRGGALKWAVAWTNTFICSLKHPKFIINLIPFRGGVQKQVFLYRTSLVQHK